MIESVDTKNKPVFTIGGQQFDFELFDFSYRTDLLPLPGALDESPVDLSVIGKWMDDSKPQMTFTIVVRGKEQIKAIKGMFCDDCGDQEIAAKNLKNYSGYGLTELMDVTGMVELSDALTLDENRVQFWFEAKQPVKFVGRVIEP